MQSFLNSYKNTRRILGILASLCPVLFIFILLLSLLGAVYPFINYIFSLLIIDALLANANMGSLIGYAASVIGLNVVLLLMIKLLTSIRDVQIYKLELEFDKKIGEKVHDLDYCILESTYFHDIKRTIDQSKMWVGGITKAISLFETILKNLLSMMLASISFLHIFRIRNDTDTTSFWTSPWPLAILMVILVLSVLWNSRMQIKINQKVVDLNKRIHKVNGGAMMFMQIISNYQFGKDIRIYGMKDFLSDSIDKIRTSPEGIRLLKKFARVKGLTPSISAIINALISTLIYLLAGMKAVNGEISTGAVVLYAGSILVFTSAISELIFSLGEIFGCCDLLEPYLQLLDIRSEVDTKGEKRTIAEKDVHIFEFRDVSFKYPNCDDWCLRNVSFTISSGEQVAVVGMNGSGKTTMIKLLCRLYDPTQGEILLDGINIQAYNIDAYRQLFGVVFQDFRLISLPLGQNIAASRQVNEPKAYEALHLSGLTGWVEKMPKRLDTLLYQDFDDEGVEISGGESQKIAIARAVYKDAPFAIFDEPTASLDPTAEYEIYTSLNRIVGSKGVIFISHRLSSCRFCQRILVFHKGEKIQEGSHEQLLEQTSGKYHELWQAQAQFYI